MAIPEDVVRTNIVWHLPGNEIAVNTLNFRHEHGTGNSLDWAGDMTQRYANLVIDGLTDSWGSIGQQFYQGVGIDRVDAYHLDTSGHALHKATGLPHADTPLVGRGQNGMLPAEVGLVVTLLGYPQNGFTPNRARKRGRIYLPGLSQTLCTSDGRVNQVQSVANGWAAAFRYMHLRVMDNFAAGFSHERAHLGVLSRTGGIFTDLDTIRVDDLFDVQRRRQDALIGAEAVVQLNPPA